MWASTAPLRVGAGIELEILDGFSLRRGGAVVSLPPTAERLVAYVALHERPVQRSQACTTLWLDALDERSGARLRTALWRLRRADPGIVRVSPTHLRLSHAVAVDAREVYAFAQRQLAGDDLPTPGHPIVGRLGADLLPDWYDDWLILWRERWRQLRLHALEALAARLAAARRFGEAVEAALAAIRGEPLRESAHRCLIEVHLAEGNQVEALRAYSQLESLLRAELGIRPSDDLGRLIAGVTRR